jgi:hypothetical protein
MEEEISIRMNIDETRRDTAEHTVSSEQDIVTGSCEHDNKPSGSTKFGEFVNL